MAIRLTKFRYGPGVYQPAGTVLTLDRDEEVRLVKAGWAQPIEPSPVEAAVHRKPETAALPPANPRRRR